jgi:hypothetical protein
MPKLLMQQASSFLWIRFWSNLAILDFSTQFIAASSAMVL